MIAKADSRAGVGFGLTEPKVAKPGLQGASLPWTITRLPYIIESLGVESLSGLLGVAELQKRFFW